MYESILVATDGTAASEIAAREAIETAASFGAELSAIFVIDDSLARTSATRDSEEDTGRRALNDMETRAAKADMVVSTTIEEGEPAQAILEYAESHDFDLIVVGGKRKSAAERRFIGNTAEAIVRRAPISVLVARAE